MHNGIHLIPQLISARVIEFRDIKELNEGGRNDQRVTNKFICKYLSPSLEFGKTKKFEKFVMVMQQSEKCDELVELVRKKVEHYRRKSSG